MWAIKKKVGILNFTSLAHAIWLEKICVSTPQLKVICLAYKNHSNFLIKQSRQPLNKAIRHPSALVFIARINNFIVIRYHSVVFIDDFITSCLYVSLFVVWQWNKP